MSKCFRNSAQNAGKCIDKKCLCKNGFCGQRCQFSPMNVQSDCEPGSGGVQCNNHGTCTENGQ